MPSSITHAYFSSDVYEKINENAKNKISSDLTDLKTFAQGPDCFFFYFIGSGLKGQDIRNFGVYMQQHKTKDFFVNLITYIKDHNLQHNAQVISFLYGFICHYILDLTVHPLVVYKTGLFDKNDKSTYKYNALHYEMEYYLDIYMIYQKEMIEAKKYKAYKHFFKTNHFNPELTNTINDVFKQTYDRDNMAPIYLKSIKQMRSFFHFYNYDRFGLKKLIYQLVDLLTPKSVVRKTCLSYNVPHKMKIHYLNLEKGKWNHPMDENEIYDFSFIELYIIALNRATTLINQVSSILDGKDSLKELPFLFPNLSYLSGKECEIDKKMQYFEF